MAHTSVSLEAGEVCTKVDKTDQVDVPETGRDDTIDIFDKATNVL